MISSLLGLRSNSTLTVTVWPSTTGTRLQCALTLGGQRTEALAGEIAQDLLRLLLHLFLFAADERNHVGVDVHGSHARITGARDRLHGGGDHARNAELLQWRERHGQHDRRTIGIGGDLPLPAAQALLVRNDLQMIGIHFRNQQRDVRLHAMIARVGDDHVAGLRKLALNFGGDGGVHGGEHQAGRALPGLHSCTWFCCTPAGMDAIQPPTGGLAIRLAGRAIARSQPRDLKPRDDSEGT